MSYSFREKLLLTVPILMPSDYSDSESLMTNQPNLVSCISYVTAKYIPGYEQVRKSLIPAITMFLQTVFATARSDTREESSNIQALIILYVFTRGQSMERSQDSSNSSELSFWLTKTTCEAFAMCTNLHRAVDGVKRQLQSGVPLNITDICVRKYLYWLWLFTASHQ